MRPLFFLVFSPPFALYIFPVVLFWQESTTIAFFFLLSPPFALYIFSRHFILGRECDHCFIFYSKPPFAVYIISAVLFWEESATISFFSTLPSLRPLYHSRRFILGRECDHCLFSPLPSLPSLSFFRLLILGKECNHYFFLFSPLHSASLCFTSFVFCGVNFRHFLTTLLTNNDKEPVKKAKKFFSRPFFLSSSKLFALYTNRTEKMS